MPAAGEAILCHVLPHWDVHHVDALVNQREDALAVPGERVAHTHLSSSRSLTNPRWNLRGAHEFALQSFGSGKARLRNRWFDHPLQGKNCGAYPSHRAPASE